MILFFLDGWKKMGNDDFIGLRCTASYANTYRGFAPSFLNLLMKL